MPEETKQEPVDFVKLLVPPHKKKSREATDKDLPTIIKDAHTLFNLCHTRVGMIPGAYAIHHSQINSKDPLNFFVTANKEIIINPKIINHTKVPVDKIEGCVTFPNNPPIKVRRFHKITVECRTLNPDATISDVITKNLSGVMAQVYQHEGQHAEGSYIYEYEK